MPRQIDIFHVGPQKTGTSWVYRCFREHPEIITSPTDAIGYYSIHYHRSRDWYLAHFETQESRYKLFDPSPEYFRSPWAAARIADENPSAKIIISLREPVERAFSHYWHEKKKGAIAFQFEDVLKNYDLYASWMEPGFYSTHIKRFVDLFGWERIKIAWFDDLERDPGQYLKELYVFVGVDHDFRPSIIDQKINVARPARSQLYRRLARGLERSGLSGAAKWIVRGLDKFVPSFLAGGKPQSLASVDPALVEALYNNILVELDELEAFLDVDLSAWRARGCIDYVHRQSAGNDHIGA